jgi:hypothetical protein
VRVGNDSGSENQGPFSELMRLQTEFYTRLTEETLKYLRRLQAASVPATPGTVLMPEGALELKTTGSPGDNLELQLEVENRQRVHCVVTPMVSPFVHPSGATWFPADTQQTSVLLAPEQIETLKIQFALPTLIPQGVFRGALLLQGFRGDAIPVAITVAPLAPAKSQRRSSVDTGVAPKARTRARAKPTAKTRAKK